MRLPVIEPQKTIDEEKALALVDYAYNHGVNYFDTAYFYHSCKSEPFIGKALSAYPRDTWYLATKMPGNIMDVKDGAITLDLSGFKLGTATFSSLEGIFEQQLDRCGVDYFDFYLAHNLTESTYELYTDEKIGIVDYLLAQKKAGRIRHLGFSAHGRPETIDRFLSRYDCFEYAQIQLNYLDWTLQDAGKKYDIITKHGLPVIVMEPTRGGKLAKLGDAGAAILKAERPDDTAASWAFRFIQALPDVPVVLSGMTAMEHLVENIEIFSKDDPMPASEKAALQKVVETMADFVPCTACRYCCAACPQGLDIPMLISTYNEASYDKKTISRLSWGVIDLLDGLIDSEKPQSCIACGACTPLCPQNIDIPDTMKKFSALLDNQDK